MAAHTVGDDHDRGHDVGASGAAESFADMGLDVRLLRALYDLGWERPTPVQARVVPLVLDGADVLARARTGSGKTAAYALPTIQRVLAARGAVADAATFVAAAASGLGVDSLNETSNWDGGAAIRAVVLVPTRELCRQVEEVFLALCKYCHQTVSVLQMSADESSKTQRARLRERPDIVISTPSLLLQHAQREDLGLKTSLSLLVIDEADLVLSFGYEDDVKALLSFLPQIVQGVLLSATLTSQLLSVQALVLHKPVVLRIGADGDGTSEATGGRLKQLYAYVEEERKFLLLYALLKLRIVPGKALLFVNSVDRCYKLKLFLERLSLRAAVLNAELPLNSRYHIVQQFSKGAFDFLLATDAATSAIDSDAADLAELLDRDTDAEPVRRAGARADGCDESGDDDAGAGAGAGTDAGDDDAAAGDARAKRAKALDGRAAAARGKRGARVGDQDEFGVARGIDFRGVDCVVNFDMPPDAQSYVHRIGRTARGGAAGTALSLVSVDEKPTLLALLALQSAGASGGADATSSAAAPADESGADGRKKRKRDTADGAAQTGAIIDLHKLRFDMGQIGAFSYRVSDVLQSITRGAIRDARRAELRAELLNSAKLKAHFEDNPLDLETLRHDMALMPAEVRPHLKRVPAYLLTAGELAQLQKSAQELLPGSAGAGKAADRGARGGRGGRGRGGRGGGGGGGKKKKNPLKSFA